MASGHASRTLWYIHQRLKANDREMSTPHTISWEHSTCTLTVHATKFSRQHPYVLDVTQDSDKKLVVKSNLFSCLIVAPFNEFLRVTILMLTNYTHAEPITN